MRTPFFSAVSLVSDPIHGLIELSDDEKRVIDTRIFQRLRNLLQLSTAHHQFPGARHSRFEHSLGALHLTKRYAQRLWPPESRSPELMLQIKCLQFAALLHDIAHGPYSHAFDCAVYSALYPDRPHHGHDSHREVILRQNLPLRLALESSGINQIVERILDIWSGVASERTPLAPLFHTIIHGTVGSDRADFVPRDAWQTGMTHLGSVSPRIIESASLDGRQRLCFPLSLLHDLLHFQRCRFEMYQQVYHHPVAMAGKLLVEELFRHLALCFDLTPLLSASQEFELLDDSYIDFLALSLRSDQPLPLRRPNVSSSISQRTVDLWNWLKARQLPHLIAEFQCPHQWHTSFLADLHRFSVPVGLKPGGEQEATLAEKQFSFLSKLLDNHPESSLSSHPLAAETWRHFEQSLHLMHTARTKYVLLHCSAQSFPDPFDFDRHKVRLLSGKENGFQDSLSFSSVLASDSFLNSGFSSPLHPTVTYRLYRLD